MLLVELKLVMMEKLKVNLVPGMSEVSVKISKVELMG